MPTDKQSRETNVARGRSKLSVVKHQGLRQLSRTTEEAEGTHCGSLRSHVADQHALAS